MIEFFKRREVFSRAVTLSELLLATAILAFVLSGVLLLFTRCILLNNENRNLATATSHAEYVLEDIRQKAFSTVQASISNGIWNWNTTQISSQGLTALSNDEAIKTEVVSGPNPLQVKVTVTWTDRSQRARSTFLETLITNY